MDTFTCAGCGKEFPSASGVKLSWLGQITFFVTTLGGLVAGRLCQDCHSGVVAFRVIGVLIGVVVLMAVSIKWLAA